MASILAEKGNYRLINDGCGTIPYIITIEKKKVFSKFYFILRILGKSNS